MVYSLSMNDRGGRERIHRAVVLPAVVAAMLSAALLSVACSSSSPSASSVDCAAKLKAYDAAVVAASQCDPTASTPCTSYGYLCGPVGVRPDSTTSLGAMLADYKAAGCTIPYVGCPIWVETPPPYTCTLGSTGVNVCSTLCENTPSGGTCVSQAMGCPNVALNAFCAGQSMVCCSSY